MIITGLSNGKLWLGAFNRDSKEKMFEWTDSEDYPVEREIDLGYGETTKIHINHFDYVHWVNIGVKRDVLFFEYIKQNIHNQDVVVVENNTAHKILNLKFNGEYAKGFNKAIAWYEGGTLLYQRPGHDAICLSKDYNLQFVANILDIVEYENIYSVSSTDVVCDRKIIDPNKSLLLGRYNIKTRSYIWRIKKHPRHLP